MSRSQTRSAVKDCLLDSKQTVRNLLLFLNQVGPGQDVKMTGGGDVRWIKHRFYSLRCSFISLPKDLILKVLLRDT